MGYVHYTLSSSGQAPKIYALRLKDVFKIYRIYFDKNDSLIITYKLTYK